MDCTMCGRFIAALRKERDWTQKDLAAQLHVTDKAVSRWETGKGLPDAETLLQLSALFDVSINELLRGERDPMAHITQETLVDVLQVADEQKQKHHRLKHRVMVGIAVVLMLFSLLIYHDMTSGGGTSLSSVVATCQARRIATHIENGRYESAVSRIGFAGRNRRSAAQEWVDAMHTVFDEDLEILSFKISPLKEEDQFISGTAQLRIYDPHTDERFVFEIAVNVQDGIAFASVDLLTGDPSKGARLAQIISSALGTYYAG